MKIAVYARKSKLTEKGESIKNQILCCKEYAKNHFDILENDIIIYEDEGFSGKNTLRPQFQLLMKDAKEKKFNILMCYKLDRVSRSISDFSILISKLEKNKINFISIKEQFDTTTPIGRAMMYISSVFAQLERETISERIIDNFTALAETGRYLGNKAPEGYNKKTIEYIDKNENKKKYNILVINQNEADKIKLIFKKYLEWKSIKKIETYLMQNGIKNRNENYYTYISIRRILTHPSYIEADEKSYEYFKELGTEIVSEKIKFNGQYGVNVLRHSKISSLDNNNYSNWIVSVGFHKWIICSDDWIKAQYIIKDKKAPTRNITGKYSMLSGLLLCENCGSYMRPFSISKNGHFYYICVTKETSKKQLCNIKNIRGDLLDKIILQKIYDVLNDNYKIISTILKLKNKSFKHDLNNKIHIDELNEKIIKYENTIASLISKLLNINNKVIENYIYKQIESIDEEKKILEKEIYNLKNNIIDIDMKDKLYYFNEISEKVSDNYLYEMLKTKENLISVRNFLKTIIDSILWDGENIKIKFLQLNQ